MRKILRLSIFLTLLMLAGACNLPTSKSSPTPNATQAYQTVEARLTEASFLTPTIEATVTPNEPASATPEITLPPLPSITNAPPASPTTAVRSCDQAAPGVPIDVTIPDDSQMQPGQAFNKVWRLQNTGTCTWTKKYSIALFSGEAMGAPASVPMPQQVAPGQSVDIAVDLVAPLQSGSYQGNWKLRNEAGTWFGIGPGGNSPFWVRIVVSGTPLPGTITVTPGTAVPTRASTPIVVVNGTTNLLPLDRLDLDSNVVNPSGGADVGLEVNQEGLLFLVPRNGARMSPQGSSTPGIAQCQAAALSEAELNLQNLSAGQYLCYITSQGLYGWMRLLGLSQDNQMLAVEILTWAIP